MGAGHRLGQEHFLGQEAVQQGHARHRGCGHHGQGRCKRHEAEKTAQLAHIPRAGLVVDDAGGHEERRLEGGVVHRVEDGRNTGQRTA